MSPEHDSMPIRTGSSLKQLARLTQQYEDVRTAVLQLPPTQGDFGIDSNGNDQLQGSRRLYNGRRKLGLPFRNKRHLSHHAGVTVCSTVHLQTCQPPPPSSLRQPTHKFPLQTPCYTSSCPPPHENIPIKFLISSHRTAETPPTVSSALGSPRRLP